MTDRRSVAWGICVGIATVVLGACAPTSRVILLPERDGQDSKITVWQDGKLTVLRNPYEAVRDSPFGPYPYVSNPGEVEVRFGEALAAQPSPPASYTLYLAEGHDTTFTRESVPVLEAMFADIAKRPIADVLIVGHTDAVGTDQVNDALSQRRAENVRAMLLQRGIPNDNIVAVGRGKRELLIPTPDGVPEPRNRRVEIFIR